MTSRYAKLKRCYDSMLMDLMKSDQTVSNIELFEEHFGGRPNELQQLFTEHMQSLEPSTAIEYAAAARAAVGPWLDWDRAQGYAQQALAKDEHDPTVQLSCGLVSLRRAQFARDDQQRMALAKQAMAHYAAYAKHREGRLYARKNASLLPKIREHCRSAWAAIIAADYSTAQEVLSEVFEVDYANAQAYRTQAYLHLHALGSEYFSLEAARQNLAIARDLGEDHRSLYLDALLLVAEQGVNWQNPRHRMAVQTELIELLQQASNQDPFGFGPHLYRQEARRLLEDGGWP